MPLKMAYAILIDQGIYLTCLLLGVVACTRQDLNTSLQSVQAVNADISMF